MSLSQEEANLLMLEMKNPIQAMKLLKIIEILSQPSKKNARFSRSVSFL
jgi:hypothetical protein